MIEIKSHFKRSKIFQSHLSSILFVASFESVKKVRKRTEGDKNES